MSVAELLLDNPQPPDYPCPMCEGGCGAPRSVRTGGPSSVIVGVVCQSCRHQWDVMQTTASYRIAS